LTFTSASTITGIDNGDYVFFNDGRIVPATTTANPPTPTIGFKFNVNSFEDLPTPDIGTPAYYLNKYNGIQVYKYEQSTAEFKFSVMSTGPRQAYIPEGSTDKLILCTGANICELHDCSGLTGNFYVNSGNPSKVIAILSGNASEDSSGKYYVYEMGDNNGLIDCSSGTCSIHEVVPRDVTNSSENYAEEGLYLGKGYKSGNSELIDAIIKCTSDYGCSVLHDVESVKPTLPAGTPAVTEAYFVNNGATKTDYPLIKFNNNVTPSTLDVVVSDTSNVYYINSDTYDSKPLIYCESTTSCEASDADESNYYLSYTKNLIIYSSNEWAYEEATSSTGYVLNGGADKYDKPLIYCSPTNKCDTVEAETGGYYIYKNTNSLIYCNNVHSCSLLDEAEEGYYLNNQRDKTSKPLISCSESTCDSWTPTKTGYFLDQSTYNNNKYSGLIYCVATNACESVSFTPGFYINSGSLNDEIIECQTSCVSRTSNSCVGITEKTIIPSGTYCYDGSIISFVFSPFELNDTRSQLDEADSDLYLVSVSSDDDAQAKYIYTTIGADIFPGITSVVSTLFRITKNSITQVIEDGIIAINTKNNARLTNYAESVSLNQKIGLYKCESSGTNCCTPINTCTDKQYIYDPNSKKGLLCDGSSLYSITTSGYYLDGSRTINGKTAYVLECDGTGNCNSLTPKNVYMLNAGFDNTTNKLIFCSSNQCSTVVASVGYYLAYDGKGVIQCTSSSKCIFQSVTTFRYFLNAGSVDNAKLVIQCYSGRCGIITPNYGYYITHSPSVLIQCTSKSSCSEVSVSDGFYSSAYRGTSTTKYIIHCLNISGNISCGLEATKPGAYVSNDSNILVICDENDCSTVEADIGTYISANPSITTVRAKRDDDNEEDEESHLQKRGNTRNIITCDAENCRELSPSELALVPICTFNNNKCFINYDYSLTSSATTTLTAGGFCTNSDRSKLYFATDTIVVESSIIAGSSSTFVYTTTNSNCLEVSKNYKSYYFTFGSNIYHLDDNRITMVVKPGYYFINVIENTLATGRSIDEYNDHNTKIYKCNGATCTTIDDLKTNGYFADVNKKIIKYEAETKKYSFAYNKDIICIYNDNHCTPKYDMEKREFCITYMGELVLATRNIPSRESGPCYKSKDINTNIYGFSEYLYKMDKYSAVLVDNTSYHIVTKSTNYTAEYKDYANKPKNIVIYGCIRKNCDMYTPKERVYYYDSSIKFMYRLVDGQWEAPKKGGYAYISISPMEAYIYKFSIKNNEVVLEKKVNSGFYYTVDKEMYECSANDCQTISDSGYVFTNNGEIYYCEYDSEELEETVCKIQSCMTGQYYYIDGYYYRCDSGSILNIMTSKYCVYSAKYVINFPTILSNDYPSKVRYAVDRIARNNNSTATLKKGRNYLPVVPAVYTNCTYNFEDKEATFDLICVRNYVTINREAEPEICSVSNMGYVYCSDDSDNPNKCNPSSAFRTIYLSLSSILMTIVTAFFIFYL